MNNTKKIKTTDIVLIIVCILLILFTWKMIQLFEEQGNVPNTLISCVFTAAAGEAGILGWIKTAKVKCLDRIEKLEDLNRMLKGQEGKQNGTESGSIR